jgi:hypothetical protein
MRETKLLKEGEEGGEKKERLRRRLEPRWRTEMTVEDCRDGREGERKMRRLKCNFKDDTTCNNTLCYHQLAGGAHKV